jgi:hypothetical protein
MNKQLTNEERKMPFNDLFVNINSIIFINVLL